MGMMNFDDANKAACVEVYQVSIAEQGVRSGVCLRPELRCTGEGCGNDQEGDLRSYGEIIQTEN